MGAAADLIYTDFAKAFDMVPRKGLLLKLQAYGISGTLLKWIEAWLIDRQQRVVIDEYTAIRRIVTSGVPQGSVLGPLIFVLFINNLPDCITQHITLYADDSKLINVVNSKADCEALQADIDAAVDWTHRRQMFFNLEKCKVMHFGQENKCTHVYTMLSQDGTRRPPETTKIERDLGVLIDDKLNVRAQVEAAAAAANSKLSQSWAWFVAHLVHHLRQATS
jgi:ribonuclease P/MRP protein subunit RPP40